jgi:Domain of unknown function (DUF4382)
VKVRSVSPAALALAAPLLTILALLLPLACGSSGSSSTTSTPQPTKGNVEIGLIDAPSAGFQNILLNLISIRLNPASNATDSTSGWVGVPVPSGVGGPVGGIVDTNLSGGGSFFYTSNPETNPGTSEIQIDLNTLQDNVQLFNTAKIPAQTYHTLQVKIDPNIPGSIVPNCSKVFPPGTEGCIRYPITIASPAALATSTAIPVGKNGLTTIVVEINPGDPVAPGSSGGNYKLAPVISIIPNAAASPGVNPKMALVSGNVHGIPSGVKERVSAEISGTGNVIASIKVSKGQYSVQLPVSSDGTSYDLFASSNGATYDLMSNVALTRGQSLIPLDFTVAQANAGKLNGTISDGCNGNPVQDATVEILSSPNNSADCSILPTPAGCVVIASTSTSVTGKFPSPGRTSMPQPFNYLPAAPDGTYAIRISASGYDTAAAAVDDHAGAVSCPTTGSGKCDFSLTKALINGTVSITPASGGSAEVQVFAEAAGTNDLVGALTAPLSIPACGSPPCSASFNLNVPTMPGTYDVFATSIDLYGGAPDPFTGHVFVTLPNVTSATQCQATTVVIPTLGCAGHGSVSGSVTSFDTNTTVRLLQGGVQVAQTPVGAAGTSNAGAYSFCAPADAYAVQRWQNNAPAGAAVGVIVPTPEPTSAPCALCKNLDGSCPGNCADTGGPTL